jgi:hypothetical protein
MLLTIDDVHRAAAARKREQRARAQRCELLWLTRDMPGLLRAVFEAIEADDEAPLAALPAPLAERAIEVFREVMAERRQRRKVVTLR